MIAPFARLSLVLLLLAAPALAQTPGQAVLLNRVGNHVDGNSFARKDAAYLSAGPTVCGAAGLADGDYYFQITDPAATVLLSRDPVGERAVRVSGGILSAYLGSTRPAANNGPCGGLNVRLAPFATTPYPSGEYRLWLTRIQDYDPLGSYLFGFDPKRSKSEGFRVYARGPQTIVRGHKFFDHDGDGVWNPALDPLEVPVGGWRIDVLRNGVPSGTTFTDQDGMYVFVRDRDASVYEFREISPDGFINDATPGATWLATTAREGFATTAAEYAVGPEFGNVSYIVELVAGRTPTYWGNRDCNCENPSVGTGPDSVCGLAILREHDPAWRTALNTRNGMPVNLRNPVSNDNPSASIFQLNWPPQSFCGAYANWRGYVNKQDHDHAGFLLSREVAAAILNNTFGFMQGDVYIDRFQDGVLVSLADMLTGAIGLLSEPGAGLTGPNDPYQDLRMRMLGCINEFGTINNTGDPSSPQVVFTRGNEPMSFASPY